MIKEPKDLNTQPLAKKLESLLASGATPIATRSFQRELSRMEKHQDALYALMQVASEVSRVAGILDLHNLVDFVLDKAITLIGAERGLLVLRMDNEELKVMSARHLSSDTDPESRALSHSLLNEVIHQGEAIVTTNAQNDPRFAAQQSVMAFSIRSVLAVPLTTSTVLGALYLDTQIATRVFEESDVPIIKAFASITASAIELVRFLDSRKELYLESVKALVSAVEAKDAYTAGHSSRVGLYSQAIMRALGKPEDEAEDALIAGFLHDVGKIGVSDSYVSKPGPLDENEWTDFRRHTIIGERILSHTKALKPILPAVRWHHEKLDGSGYPDGLKHHEIPFIAKVVCVADSFDAMTSDRPYRASPGRAYAFSQLDKFKDLHYDTDIVEALKTALDLGLVPYLGKS